MKLLIIDIDWIVGKTNRLRNFDIDWPRYPSIGLDYRLDWIIDWIGLDWHHWL